MQAEVPKNFQVQHIKHRTPSFTCKCHPYTNMWADWQTVIGIRCCTAGKQHTLHQLYIQVRSVESMVKQGKQVLDVCLRFIGVSHLKASGKWKCRAPLNGRPGSSGPTLGAYTTEELAAQAYDKMLIYTASTLCHYAIFSIHQWSKLQLHSRTRSLYMQGMATKNFPREKYDVQPILMHETIDSLVASIRAEAAASEQRQQHPQKLSAAAGM